MDKIKIERDIYVRDEYGVRRLAFKAGSEVDRNVYNRVLTVDTVVNARDLPKVEAPAAKVISEVEPKVEVLTSEDGAAVERERLNEADGHAKAVEMTAKVAADQPTGAGLPVPNEVAADTKVEAKSADEPKAKKSKKEGKE